MAELECSTLSAWIRHRRTAARAAFLLSAAAVAGFAGALLAPDGETTVVQPVRQETHVVQVAVPVAAAPEPAAAPPIAETSTECPPTPPFSDKRAGYPLDRADDEWDFRLGGVELTGVAGSTTRADVLAAWNEASIYLSTDDGSTFAQVLDGPGDVAAVAFDCRDRVYAWRSGLGLGVRDASGEAWRPLEVFDVETLAEADEDWGKRVHLAVRGDTVAVAGPAKGRGDQGLVAVTHDAGMSWRFADLGYYDRIAGLTVEANGSVFVAADWTDCMVEGTNAVVIPRGAAEVRSTALGNWGTSAVGEGRLVYSVGADCEAALCVHGASKKTWRPVRGLPNDASEVEFVPSTRGSFVRADDRLYALEGARAKRLGPLDRPVDLVDSAGRGLRIDKGRLHRHSKRLGERLLLGQRTARR